MTLRSQDVLVALKLAVSGGFGSYAELAAQLGMSSSQVPGTRSRPGAVRSCAGCPPPIRRLR